MPDPLRDALVPLLWPCATRHAQTWWTEPGPVAMRAALVRDGDPLAARTPAEAAADRALGYLLAAEAYPANTARYRAWAAGWAREAVGQAAVRVAHAAGVEPADRTTITGAGDA